MKNVTFVVAAMLATSVTLAADSFADLKTLQGTWKVAAAELSGRTLGGDFTGNTKLIIEGDRYVVMVGATPDKGTLKIDAGKSPKWMDINGTEGPNKGKSIPAIYEISGDTLRICYDLGGTTRPTEFKTKPETKLFLATYKRDK